MTTAAGIARLTAHPEGTTPVELRWGTQGGVRPLAHDAHRDGAGR